MWEPCRRCWMMLSGWSGLREGGRLAPSPLSFPLFPKMALKVLQGNLGPHITQFEKHCSAYQPHQRAEHILCYSLLFQCSLLEAAFFFNLGIISWPRKKLRMCMMPGTTGASVRLYTMGNGGSFGMTPPVSVSTMEMMRSTSGNPIISWNITLK